MIIYPFHIYNPNLYHIPFLISLFFPTCGSFLSKYGSTISLSKLPMPIEEITGLSKTKTKSKKLEWSKMCGLGSGIFGACPPDHLLSIHNGKSNWHMGNSSQNHGSARAAKYEVIIYLFVCLFWVCRLDCTLKSLILSKWTSNYELYAIGKHHNIIRLLNSVLCD